jgi:hypothetical protein
MKTVTNRSHAKSMTINIGGKEHSYKKYSWGLHHPTFGPLKDEKFNSKTEMKSAMEKHPRYNPKLQNEEVAVNAAGAGNVAGLGVGPQGEPGVKKKKKNVMSFNRFMKK